MMPEVRFALLALLALSLAASRPAWADPPAATPTARLDVTRGPGTSGCPTDEEIRNAVSGRLGYDPFQPDAKRLVSASIAREGKGLTVTVGLRNEAGRSAGSRVLSSAQNDCVELASAMTLAISIAIDPLAFTRAATPPPAPPPTPPAPVSAPPPVDAPPPTAPAPVAPPPAPPEPAAPQLAPPPPPARSSPERASSEALAFQPSFATVASVGAAPGLAFGVAGQLAVRRGAMSIGIEGRKDFPVFASTPGSGGGVTTSLWLASLVPCVHRSFFAGCALGSAGALQGTGYGVDRPQSQTTPYAAAGARVAADFDADRPLSLQINVDFLATLIPTKLLLNGTTAWTTPPASGALGLALVGNFL